MNKVLVQVLEKQKREKFPANNFQRVKRKEMLVQRSVGVGGG
jgi:hypothetical protein